MAPIVRRETMELLDDCLDAMFVDFDEITSLANSEDFDNTKFMLDSDVGLAQQPALVLPPPSPITQPQLVDQEYFIHSDSQPASPEFVTLQPATPKPFLQQSLIPAPVPQQDLSPDPSNIQVQSASSTPQLVGQKYIVHLDTQPTSPDFILLQPVTSEPLQHSLTQEPIPQQTLSPELCDIQMQPASSEQSQYSANLEPLTESPSNSFTLSPLSVLQQEEEAATPAPQQVVSAPKKRGRKRKYPEGMAPSRRRPHKLKVYEMGPQPNEEMEKKRKNALNAKRHRDMQKEEKQKLSKELAEATSERDRLRQMVNQYKQREQQLLQLLSIRNIKIDGLNHPLEGL